MSKRVSNCCKAPATVSESGEGTCYYVCEKCQKACDLIASGPVVLIPPGLTGEFSDVDYPEDTIVLEEPRDPSKDQ